MKRTFDTLPTIVATPHLPPSTVLRCDECGSMSIAWHEGRWTTDCLYDCCCLDCFKAALGDREICANPEADLFPHRVEIDVNGFVTVYRPDTKPWVINLNLYE